MKAHFCGFTAALILLFNLTTQWLQTNGIMTQIHQLNIATERSLQSSLQSFKMIRIAKSNNQPQIIFELHARMTQ